MNIQNITSDPEIRAMRAQLTEIDARLDEIRKSTSLEDAIERDTLYLRWASIKTKYDQKLRCAMEAAR